jgi:hypothetical protein
MGSVSQPVDAAIVLGRVRWQGGTPSLMGRAIAAGSKLQVFVPTDGAEPQRTAGVWMDAEVLSTADGRLGIRSSFARFTADSSLRCRWPADAPPMNRGELQRLFAESVTDVTAEMESVVKGFLDDPLLKSSPVDRLLTYGAAMRESAMQVRAIASILEKASRDLSARVNRSMLVVAQDDNRARADAVGNRKRL